MVLAEDLIRYGLELVRLEELLGKPTRQNINKEVLKYHVIMDNFTSKRRQISDKKRVVRKTLQSLQE